jgi:DNA-binding NarL/FixJ family response regulator
VAFKTKIILVDDHSGFREGMKLLIEMEGLGEVIAEAENGQVFIDLLESLDPDLVIMDIEMPVMGGVEAIRKAMIIRPGLKILVLTLSSGQNYYSSAINAGAMGFVLKSAGKQILEKAIKTLKKGECYFS